MDDPIDADVDLPDTADEAALRRVRTVARIMDEAVSVPKTDVKIGLDPILGVLPGAGDLLSATVSLYIVAEAAYLGVPLSTVVKMLGNVAVDVGIGSIPVVGDLFDVFWKANAWNVEQIEEFLDDAVVEAVDGGDDRDDGPVTIDVTDPE
ncbi:DUF4112 domain-containing protein [Candidatus Halobonum tyrrellensis]|uniref:DUF4112 domain-containing protein n=1 Tax=Candidatus Halobonum tyrrellensis G22 TaxID=1324957 RepID=V4GS26_9EURY|nr:DUF4112 domain-containing protein [Candidatus Halobonum tyrrellensis]ESP87866.1 hypothetical protein K933_11926 [Candidatus Halobonum tyrrellensis G22]